jgi:hypothetical protein
MPLFLSETGFSQTCNAIEAWVLKQVQDDTVIQILGVAFEK